MTIPPIGLQDLRRKIYAKAKSEPPWRSARTASRSGFDWKRWSRRWPHARLEPFGAHRVSDEPQPKALPA